MNDGGDWQRHRILGFLREFAQREGYSPSYREIGESLGIAVSTVSYHLGLLRAEGSLDREPGRPRAITWPGSSSARSGEAGVELPLIGQVAAGLPLLAEEAAEETFALPRGLVGHGQLFMLRVRGDSMTGAAIVDGDLVVIRKQDTAESGEIVAAQFDGPAGSEATVKTLQRADGCTWLMPANPAYQPIPAGGAVILGKMVALVRPATAPPGRRRARSVTPRRQGSPQAP